LQSRYGHEFESVLLVVVAVVLLLVSFSVLFRSLFMRRAIAAECEHVDLNRRRKVQAGTIGAVLGLVLGLTSVGSGALVGMALIFVFRLTPHRVVGTDVFHAAILLWSAGLAHWVGGNVDLGLMANILVGSLPGVWIGASLITRVPADALRPALGCVLLGSALGVLTKAGAEIPTAAIVGVPLTAGLGAYAIHRVLRVRERVSISEAPA
jgi:uncharacterized membrane protein YfcA